MNATQTDRTTDRTNNEYFKMGAVVAVGELYDEGKLGDKRIAAPEVASFLKSFGVHGIEDMRRLGMSDQYLGDFAQVYAQSHEG